jgi:PmbA protein
MARTDGLDELHGTVESALDRWTDRTDGLEIFLLRQTGGSVSGEKDRIVRSSGSAEFGIGVRTISDGRLGFSYCTDPDGLDVAIRSAVDLSHLGSGVSGTFRPCSGVDVPDLYDPSVADLTVEDLRDITQSMIDSAKDIDPDVTVVSTGASAFVEELVIANTAGPPVSHRGTYISAGISTLYRTDPPATGFDGIISRKADIDASALASTAVDMAYRSRDPVKCEGGLRPVVLRHSALTDILEFTLFPAMIGSTALKGNSVFHDRIGDTVGSDVLDISDRQDMPGGCGSSPFDDEGVHSRNVPLIEEGVLKGYIHDIGSASEHGAETTASAKRSERWSSSRSFRAPPAPRVRNAHIEGNADDIVSDMDSGILVVAVMGAHTSNPVSGDFSLNTNIAFEVEGGEISRALKPMMIAGNVLDLLGRTSMVGRDHRYHSGSMSAVGGYIPSIFVDGLNVTT